MDGGRNYGGLSGDQRRDARRRRLLDAGIELMGDERELTVRGTCRAAGLGPRYFYESFDSPDALRAAVVEAIVTSAAEAVAAGLASAPAEGRARSRAAIESFVAYAIDDPRRARILFGEASSAEALREQRAAALRLFAEIAAAQGRELYGVTPGSDHLAETTSYLVAGGMAELLLAWSRGELASARRELIDDAVDLLAAVGEAAATIAARRARDRPGA